MTTASPAITMPFKISVLVFIKDSAGRFLLIRRRKAPNKDRWSPIGGKLEMAQGESPFECAVRETAEETGHRIVASDLHLFGMVSERGYEGSAHWLMFLFDCHKPLESLPPEIDEGDFGFFEREKIGALDLPPTDHTLVWPVYDQHRQSFIAYRADCSQSVAPGASVVMTVDEAM